MADTNISGSKITTVDKLIQSGAVPSSEIADLLETLRTQQDYNLVRSTLEKYASGREVNIDAVLGDSKRYLVQQTEQAQSSTKQNSGFGNTAASLIAGAGMLATGDTSGSDKIVGAIEQAQREALFGDQSPFADELTSSTLTNDQFNSLTSSLSEDSLLNGQYQELERRINASEISEAEKSKQLADLQTRHDTFIKARAAQKNNLNKSWWQRRRDKQQLKYENERKARLRKELDAVKDGTTGKGRKKRALTEAEKQQRRREILEQYAQEQQRKNRGHMHDLLSQRRFLGLGRKTSLTGQLRGMLLRNIRNEEKKRKDEAKAKKKTKDSKQQPTPDQFIPEPMPQPSQEFQEQEDNQDNQGGGPSLPRLPKNLPTEPPIGGLAGGAGEAAAGGTGGLAAAAPYIAIGVGIIILIIVVIYVLTHLQDNSLPQLTRLNCGYYDSYIVSLGTTTQIGKSFNQQFGPMLLGDQQNPQDSNAINAEKQFFNDVCTLFGGVDIQQYPDPTKPYEFNTFGTLVDGSVNQRKGGGPSLLHFQFRFLIKDGTPCSISYDGKNNQIVTWRFHSPETCTSGQFDFLAGKVLAFSLILQQNYLHASNVFTSFNATPDAAGQIGQGLLPTNDCTSGKDYGQNSGNPQNVDCFGDMVGAYLSYPFYFDAPITPVPSISPSPTKTITPTPTASPSPSQADNPLLTYPTGDYAHYYTFAKYQLFDGQDIITQPTQGQVGCAIPLHASNPTDIEKSIETTFNIKVIGDVDTAKLTQVYNTLCIVLTPSIDGKPIQSTYKTLLDKATPVAINIDTVNYSCVTGYTQVVSDSSNLCTQSGTKANCSTMGWCNDQNWGVAANRFTLVHELTHLVRAYNQQIDTNFNTYYKLDGRLLPTDNCQLAGTKGFGANPESECLSDLAGEYVTYLSYKHTATTRNPKIAFPELADPKGIYATWYLFAKRNLFGGVAYGVNDSAASYADSLAKAIIANCPDPKGGKLLYGLPYGVVNSNTIGCLIKLTQTFSGALQELRLSVTTNFNLQCVGFVHAVAAAIGKPLPDGSGDAQNHNHAFPGYTWTPAPPSANKISGGYLASHALQPGDIVVWGHKLNHIAYVVAVNDNGSTIPSFMVAEANGEGKNPGTVFTQKWYVVDSNILGWLRAQ